MKGAKEVQDSLEEVNKALFVETNPIPVKYLLYKLGFIENELRLPLLPLSQKNWEKLDLIAEQLK